MRIRSTLTIIPLFITTITTSTATKDFDCDSIIKDDIEYSLFGLSGAHSVSDVKLTDNEVVNMTYVVNLCNSLGDAANWEDLKCGSHKSGISFCPCCWIHQVVLLMIFIYLFIILVCGFKNIKKTDGSATSSSVFPIARSLYNTTKTPDVTRLKALDPDREGLLIKVSGGEYVTNDPDGDEMDGRKKKKVDVGANIELKCDPDRSGLEGHIIEDDDDDFPSSSPSASQVDKEKDPVDDEEKSLRVKSFGPVDDGSYLLQLDWRTRYACDNYLKDRRNRNEGRGRSSSNGWGFFTWIIILYVFPLPFFFPSSSCK